ncbi:hypothetical protein PHSY_004827 [Pseudozyma hubeiensis SY62]|uniref:SPT2 chromatin protein n=1 Tax=Pseudozyma hubeiensis (strain SY62) TaxID=1305764 RepID=R9P7K5_PSEHS|nr:hypothetical protein PHSY_004827 [Pseudozyma hubeiensis SY62]GAC97242.1 hypothetical protein PHSY_004827 [Pseudozyma hubeiensis SY62]
MSSYAKLKEMALKKAEEEQATLNQERERKEREAAAKLAAREAQEKAQQERERKILVQRMTRQKEEEARERMRKEHAVKLEQDRKASDLNAATSKQAASNLPKPASIKASGSTQKIDLSHRLKPSSASGNASRKKRKVDEDDFVGNRLDRVRPNKTERQPSSASSSASRKKAIPMTREEKQAIKRAREFGSLPRLPPIGRIGASSGSARNSPSIGAGEADRPARPSGRAQMAKDNGLVALGTKKRDQRTIDEIERDLRKLKEANGQGRSDGPSQAELEREAALARRQKAMEEKRRSDLKARERAALRKEDGDGNDSTDDLFGSDSNENKTDDVRRGNTSQRKDKTQHHTPANHTQSDSRHASRPSSASQSVESKAVAGRAMGGINPADFLPGAPLRPEAIARLSQKARSTPESAPASRRRSPDFETTCKSRRFESESKSSPAPATASPSVAPPRRETARDRFIREQEEKKRAAAGSSGYDGRRAGGTPARSAAEYDGEEDDYSDEYDSEGIDDDDDDDGRGGGSQNYRDEIWKLFGKDRKKYASRVVDSDDDMEADAASVLQEELRSSKHAREEDLREEQMEKQREREKLLRKQGAKRI